MSDRLNLGLLRQRLLQAFPGQAHLVDEAMAIEASYQEAPVVRIMRVLVFEGTQEQLDDQLARSLGDGTRIVKSRRGPNDPDVKIHVATIGSMQQILPLRGGYPNWGVNDYSQPIAQPLGARLVYVASDQWFADDQTQTEYERAVACGADTILIPSSNKDGRDSLYTLDRFRTTFLLAKAPPGAVAEVLPATTTTAAPTPTPSEIAQSILGEDAEI